MGQLAFNIMKMRVLYIVGLVFLAAFSGIGWAVGNPVGPSTVPPSSGRSGLIRSPNPIDTSRNLVVTGNVGGGKHFRGVVPYRSTSDFGAPTGSSLLDSFLRRSIGQGSERYTGRYEPYYSQTRTVTTTRPGQSAVIRPPTTLISGRAAVSDSIGTLPPLSPQRVVVPESKPGLALRRLRPMSMTPRQLEKMISSEVAALGRGGEPAAEQRQARTEQFRRDLKQVKDTAAELERGLAGRDDFLKLSAPKKLGEDVRQRETPIPKEQAGKRGPEAPFIGFEAPDKKLDVYEQMKRQILGLRKPFKPSAAIQETKGPAEGEEEAAEEAAGGEGEEGPPIDELSGVRLSARAKTVMGSYESFASFSEDKFNRYIRAAEQYLKQGKYYRAADAYTLASIYKSDDPLAYAGKSHALFAAGEYMSSALFLSRALAIFPEYARFKIDIEAMVGDRDKLESRVADVEEWLGRSGAAELQFLLGYVYYQMDRPERAKEAIDGAYEKMPDAPAVIALKEAIYEYIDSK